MSTASQKLDEVIHEIACVALDDGQPEFESDPLLTRLKSLGTELWVDTGELEKARPVWRKECSALTTNNTLANQVVQSGVMDEVIRETVSKVAEVAADLSEEELVTEIGFVVNCRIALRLVEAFRTRVSVELHPCMSRNLERSLIYARRYYRVCPEFFTIKIPLTPEGYLAVRKLRKEGLPINFTLGFSARQNYLAARLSNPDYLNVFLGRLNQVVVDNGLGSGDMVGEKVTLATQSAMHEVRNGNGDVTTRLIGASVRNGEQVGFLAGLDVLTIPPAAMEQFLNSGKSPEDITSNVSRHREIAPGIQPGARSRFDRLWEVTDDFKDFVDQLSANSKLDSFTGDDLEAVCDNRGVDLFHKFTDSDLKKIREDGKIPRLADWPETIVLDDLMTQSALQSFSKDQDALDDKIRSFLG